MLCYHDILYICITIAKNTSYALKHHCLVKEKKVFMAEYPHTDDIKRQHTMRRIKSKNTSIEESLQKALWHSGIRYRKNYKKLPGAPDIAITKYRIAIFCDGEFWHGKD